MRHPPLLETATIGLCARLTSHLRFARLVWDRYSGQWAIEERFPDLHGGYWGAVMRSPHLSSALCHCVRVYGPSR